MFAYNKAVVAFIGAAVTIAGAFGVNTDIITPELQTTIASLVTAALVYFIPNRP